MKKLIIVIAVLLLALISFWYLRDNGRLGTTGQFSRASTEEMWRMMGEEHVVGGYAVKTKFSKEESPLLWVGSYHPGVIKVATEYMNSGGAKGVGSDSFKDNKMDSANIVDAINKGMITCEKIENASVAKMVPGLVQYARTMCFAPLPAFDPNFKQIIVILLDVPFDDLNLAETRKKILKLQVNVHNREYLGQETWAEGLLRVQK